MERRLPSSTARVAYQLRRHGLPLGTDTADSSDVYLKMNHLARHLHLLGPPGAGKTRVLLGEFQALCASPDATVVLVNPKGALCRMARDWMIEHGMAKRLVWFDPGDPNGVLGYNPLKPNSLPIHTHAKAVRENLKASRGQASFDETPRLAHYLFLTLALARMFEWDLEKALQLLRPVSGLRRQILPRIPDPFLRESLAAFDNLSRSHQEERAESTISRLEAFVCDETIRRIFTHSPSLDIGEVIERRQVLLVNVEISRPLSEDDAKLILRFIVNDILSHVRRRRSDDTSPVFLIGDEVQCWMTRDLCSALDQGRELGLWCTLAHQRLGQLRSEETSGDLYDAVMGCARTKLLFGGISVEDLRVLVPEVTIDQYNPLIVKDQRTSLEVEPVESTREVVTSTRSSGQSLGETQASSTGKSRGVSHGISRQWGTSFAHSDALSLVHSSGNSSGLTTGETLLPDGQILSISSAIAGTSAMDAEGMTATDSYGEFQANGEQDTFSISESETEQIAVSKSANHSRSESRSVVPFLEPHVRRVISSLTFFTPEETDRMHIRHIKGQPDCHFLLKTENHPAIFCKALFVPDPKISPARREQAMAEIFQDPIYSTTAASEIVAPAAPYQLEAPMVESSDDLETPSDDPSDDDSFLR